jgi:hypothetical protein
VAVELGSFGFEWFWFGSVPAGSRGFAVDELAGWLRSPDRSLLEGNRRIAGEHFDLEALPGLLEELCKGWL